ncbi:MAG: 50S ribosomal protein L44e [Candidatus Marsarchaeota archaeon]|jgi:large subunit ribosomal protein L44e|nr:50S ribosomal protein L44e [Candidatus Marsarchaeota archaeon]
MEIEKEVKTFCPKCNKHTVHSVKLYSKGPGFGIGMNIGNRRNVRKRKGIKGKVKGQATMKKISKKQKTLLKCKVCSYTVEKVFGTRTKKKLEVKK